MNKASLWRKRKALMNICKTPNIVLDTIKDKFDLATDRELANHLDIGFQTISKIRTKVYPVSDTVILRIHEICGLTISEIRRLIELEDFRALTNVRTSNTKPTGN